MKVKIIILLFKILSHFSVDKEPFQGHQLTIGMYEQSVEFSVANNPPSEGPLKRVAE